MKGLELMKKLNRREFIGTIAGLGAGLFVGGCQAKTESVKISEAKSGGEFASRTPKFNPSELAVASGSDPGKMTREAVEALGGMDKLVRKGDVVVIKPNIAWNRPADAAATTNPKVVAEIVKMCKEAGAGKVIVAEHLIDRPAEAVLGLTGVGPAAEGAGATVLAAQNESDYRSVALPKGKILTSDTCIKDILKADVFINVPIAKSHSATKLTLGMKNMMGCNWDRQAWHQAQSLDQCIADYASGVRPDLVILDAYRVLLTNGPKGPGETKDIKKIIAGTDIVAVDAYGATLFGIKPEDIGYVKIANEMGLGEIDLSKVKVLTA